MSRARPAGVAALALAAALGLIAAAETGLPPARADDPPPPPPVRFLGTVTAVDGDAKGFTFLDLEAPKPKEKDKDKPAGVRVLLEGVIETLAHKAVKLKEVEGGQIYVLARWIPGRMRVKPRLADVQCIVCSVDAYGPPAVPKTLADKKIEWITGAFVRLPTGIVTVQAAPVDGPERRATLVERVTPAAIAAGKVVYLEMPPGSDPKTKDLKDVKELKPERITILTSDVPLAEAKLVLGAQ